MTRLACLALSVVMAVAPMNAVFHPFIFWDNHPHLAAYCDHRIIGHPRPCR